MKRIWALSLAILVLFLMIPSLGEGAEEPREEEYTSLSVANPTPMRGQFFTDLWGNATSDIDVRGLLHAYNLITWDSENGMFTVDPSVVSGVVAYANEAGDHVYTMVLYDDLYYSDGTRITAWDYAFTWLLTMSPEIEKIGGRATRQGRIAGYEAWASGKGPLSGVRVLGENMLSVTLSHEFLPYFFEMGLLSCEPAPIGVIAPGVVVKDDGQGVYLASAEESEEPVFTAELLKKTILDPETGYQSHPSVVSGPYILVSWDGEKAEFEINPYYKGNARGKKPEIDHLTYTSAPVETMMERLLTGEYGLLNKVTRADVIAALMDQMEEAGLLMSSYPRVGQSYISFDCEKPTVSSQAVRQAIACCFDRDAALAEYTGPFGIRVDGFYGLGQWMYRLVMGGAEPPVKLPEEETAAAQAAYEAELEAYGELTLENLDPYALDTGRAAALLDEDGWVLNEEGIREKDGTKLELHLIYPEGNTIESVLQTHLVPHLETVGIRLTMEAVPMDALLGQWYAQEARAADMIYLASDFHLLFDPASMFVDGGEGKKLWAFARGADEELYRLAEDMDRTEPGNVLEYMQKWQKFQERFNETLPMLPFYSNIYFDFHTASLHSYGIAENMTWSQAIVEAAIRTAPEPEEEAAEESEEPGTEEDDGLEEFE